MNFQQQQEIKKNDTDLIIESPQVDTVKDSNRIYFLIIIAMLSLIMCLLLIFFPIIIFLAGLNGFTGYMSLFKR